MRADVEEFVSSCDNCQRNKASNQKPNGLLQPLQVPEGLWTNVSMDLITRLPETKHGNTAIVVFVDRLAKMVRLVPFSMAIGAEQYATLFVREVFAKHGLPESIVSDRDTRFTSDFFRQLCELLGIKQCMSTAFRLQSDGQTERMNRSLEEMLQAFVGPSKEEEWDKLLPCCEFAINNAFNECIRSTPFSLNYGRHPWTPTNHEVQQATQPGEQFVADMATALEKAKAAMRVAQERQARYANKGRRDVQFSLGDYVLLDSKHMKVKIEYARKFMHRFIGQFEILKKIIEVAYELEIAASMKMHDVFHVSLLRPYHKRPELGEGAPPAVLPNFDLEEEVAEVVDHDDDIDGERWYQVKWVNHGDVTWGPEAHLLNSKEKLKAYFDNIF